MAETRRLVVCSIHRLGWWDRVRVLFGSPLRVEARFRTEDVEPVRILGALDGRLGIAVGSGDGPPSEIEPRMPLDEVERILESSRRNT